MQTSAGATRILPDVLCNDRWKNYLATLAKATGFTLRMFSSEGTLLYSTSAIHPPCEAIQAYPGSKRRCDQSCHATLMAAIRGGEPRTFKCNAKIMNFMLPIEYRGEKAFILGLGSFSSYADLISSMNDLQSFPMESAALAAPTFTSEAQTRNVYSLLESSVADILANSLENVALQKRMESLQSLLEGWSGAVQMDVDSLYGQMMKHLSAFIEGHSLVILSENSQGSAFVAELPQGVSGTGQSRPSIDQQNPLIKRLLAGEEYVWAEGDVTGSPGKEGSCTLFPVLVNGRIESLLMVVGAPLSENDVRMILAFCRHTALAIENRRQHNNLYGKLDRLAALAKFAEATASIHNEQTLMQMILEQSANLLLAEQSSLMLLDHETDALLLEAKKGFANGEIGKIRIPRGEGIAGKVAELGEPLLVENIENDPRVGKKSSAKYKTSSFVSVPLKLEQRPMGVMNFADKATGEVFNEEDLQLAQAFANHAAVLIDRNALSAQMDQLKKLSITDPLTGLLNRRYLQDRLEEELARSQRYSRQLSVIMLDLDGFKKYNDTFGHPAGDRLLEAMAVTILRAVRTIEIVARYGGDEFVIILPETDKSKALMVGERVRNDIGRTELPMNGEGEHRLVISASLGIACYPEHETTAAGLLERADIALYRAKAGGKNRVEVYA